MGLLLSSRGPPVGPAGTPSTLHQAARSMPCMLAPPSSTAAAPCRAPMVVQALAPTALCLLLLLRPLMLHLPAAPASAAVAGAAGRRLSCMAEVVGLVVPTSATCQMLPCNRDPGGGTASASPRWRSPAARACHVCTRPQHTHQSLALQLLRQRAPPFLASLAAGAAAAAAAASAAMLLLMTARPTTTATGLQQMAAGSRLMFPAGRLLLHGQIHSGTPWSM